MKKIFVLVVIGFLIIAGCAREKAGGKEEIVIWHWMSDRQEAFDVLSSKYEDLTGIKAKFSLYAPSDAYSQKIKAAAQTDTLPDIYGILGEKKLFALFIQAGNVLDLTDEMNANLGQWRNTFFPRALAVNEFQPGNSYGIKSGIYGAPLDVSNVQMVYNKSLFKKAGLDPDRPPKSWYEFITAGKKLKKAGIDGFVSGWGEIWMIESLALDWAMNLMGEEKVMATFRGDIPYTDPEWIKVFSLFKQMQDAGMLYDGIVIMVNKTAERLFATGKAAMAFNGSWCVNVYKEMNPELDYGVFPPPLVSDTNLMRIWGGAGSSFVINKKSAKPKEAIAFLKWLTAAPQQAYLAERTLNLPANKESLDVISFILAEFADDMDIVTHPNIWPVAEFPLVREAMDKGIQSIITGEKTPRQVAKEIQRVKVREIEREQK